MVLASNRKNDRLREWYTYIVTANRNMHNYCNVLELQTADRKVVDLEAKIKKMEEEKREKIGGELLLPILLYSKSM